LETNFELIPLKKITINDVQYYPLQTLINFKAAQQVPMLGWAKGVLFSLQPFSVEVELIARDMLDGIMHWGSIDFSFMEKYDPIVMSDTNYKINVLDQSTSKVASEATDWLRKWYKENSAKPLTASNTSN